MPHAEMKKHYNIGLFLTAENSCYNAAFGFANALQSRGHSVIFLVNEGSLFIDYVKDNGFGVIEILPITESVYSVTKQSIVSKFNLWRRLTRHSPSVLLKQQRLVHLIKENNLDIFFIDDVRNDVNLYAVALAKNKIPTALISYTFSSQFSSDYPPIFSSRIPSGKGRPNVFYRALYRWLWGWTISTKGRIYSYALVDFLKQSFKKFFDQIRDIGFEQELRQFGWGSAWSEWKRRPLIPQVVFGHHMMDWPAIKSNPARCYFGTSDLWRKKSDFDWSRLDLSKPVIYCNISTTGGFGSDRVSSGNGRKNPGVSLSKRNQMAKRYLEVVLACFSNQQDWQLLLACGSFSEVLVQDQYPSNIHIFERLPQLAVLEKANLAITWGGAGTVRECINSGVPMLVFPAWTDQFGNAARVFSKRTGLCGNIQNVTSSQMTEMVQYVLTDETINTSIKAMREQCSAESDILELVRFVKKHLNFQL
ncbi:MAG: hypothetical protein I8H95_06315 [Rhodocyclales bacterium]|nr:hypothetical protein [Rhodocyclales bacterium]